MSAMKSTTSAPPEIPGASSQPISVRAAVGVIAPAVVLVIGMVAAVNLAIPKLQASSLHPSVSGTAWIVDSYTLVFACLLIPAGALGDRFGRRRGMLAGLGIFAVGAVIAALAPSVAVLMIGRAIGGVGAALVLPATLAVTLGQLTPAQRPHAVALWSALSGIAGVAGNLGGGLAVQLGGWRLLFWAGAPIALAAGALIATRVPEQDRHRDPVDIGGAGLLTAGMVALLYGVIEGAQLGWGAWQVLGALVLALVIMIAFVLYGLRLAHPMLDPRLFTVPGVRLGALGIVALFFALFGFFYLNSQYLQDVKGFSPLLSGVAILPLALVMPLASTRSVGLSARLGRGATIVGGLLLLVAGFAALSCVTAGTPYELYGVILVSISGGMGLAMPPLSQMMVHALPPSHAGVAAGLNSTTRELGSAIGVAVFSTLLIGHLHGASPTAAPALFTAGMSLALRVGAGLILLTAALVFTTDPEGNHPA